MAHFPPASPGMHEQFFRRWKLKTQRTRASARHSQITFTTRLGFSGLSGSLPPSNNQTPSAMPGVGTPMSVLLPDACLTMHLTVMPLLASGGPTGLVAPCLLCLGCARPTSFVNTRRSPVSLCLAPEGSPGFPFPGKVPQLYSGRSSQLSEPLVVWPLPCELLPPTTQLPGSLGHIH